MRHPVVQSSHLKLVILINLRVLFLFCFFSFAASPARADTVAAVWNYPTDVPVTANGYTAAGNSISLSLDCIPGAAALTVISNTGTGFIQGVFDNLAQGQAVDLAYGGKTYHFVANYYGGNGNDLVLVRADARILTWGSNSYGQLGDNTKTQRESPVAVTSSGSLAGKTVTSMTVGGGHSLAVCSDGTVVAWGSNYAGELGTGTTSGSKVPAAVNTTAGMSALAGKTVVAVTAGEMHSLALTTEGRVVAWGGNYEGELGTNSSNDSLVPVEVSTAPGISALAGKEVTSIAAGQWHSLALCSDGTVASWGFNGDGELGNGSSSDSAVPVTVDRSGALAGKTVVAIAAGCSHSLALCSDGTVVAWGDNTFCQLGINSTTGSLVPVAVNTIESLSALAGKTVVAISAGGYHSLALCADGTLVAWGYNGSGQLGDNSTTQRLVPVVVVNAAGSVLYGRTVATIQAGESHSQALCTDGTLVAWGWNGSGQLGDGTISQRPTPVMVNTSGLSVGEQFVLAGSGCTASHSMGLAASVPAAVPIITLEQPVGVPVVNGQIDFGSLLIGNPVALSVSIRNKGNGTLTGFTITKDGPHGAEFVIGTNPVSPVAPGRTASFTLWHTPAAEGARNTTLYITSNDPVHGSLAVDLTGNGLVTGSQSFVFNRPSDIPLTVPYYTAAGQTVDLTLNCAPAGAELTVLRNTGADWIQGYFGNLQHGQRVRLFYLGAPHDFVANYYGGSGNDLVLVPAATRAFAWGYNSLGNLGDGTTTGRKTPVPVSATGVLAFKTVTGIAAGSQHNLALCADGRVVAWGLNDNGQLGDNTIIQCNSPVAVNTTQGVSALYGKTVVAVACGYSHSLALCSDGTVAAWGQNNYGQLGDGTTTDRWLPVIVNASAGSALYGKKVVGIAGGYAHSLALCSDGTLAAWGYNASGQLGDNTTINRSIPVAVNTAYSVSALFGKTVVSIATGTYHNLALCSDATLVAWGNNYRGRLGDNTSINRFVPVQVNNAAGVSALHGKTVVCVSVGDGHSLAACDDGALAAWGNGGMGRLGNGIQNEYWVPTVVDQTGVLEGRSVHTLAGGTSHSVAMCADGAVSAWGHNGYGQLGDGTYTDRLVPVITQDASLASGERFIHVTTGSGANHTLALASYSCLPTVTTMAASETATTGTTATLHGLVNANGFYNAATTFEYGTTTDYGTTVAASPAVLTGTSEVAVSASISGLSPGATCHYRVNSGGVHGEDMTFIPQFSHDVILASLVDSESSLVPAFDGETEHYTAQVSCGTESLTLTPVVRYPSATVTVNGMAVPSGSASNSIPLVIGTNTISVVVTAYDGVTTKTYTIEVERAALPANVPVAWNSPGDVPVGANHYTAAGNIINLSLNCVPLAGELTIVRNTGPDFIHGEFANLGQGQLVDLIYDGRTYHFVANYFGGSGNDLVLVWAGTKVVAWGNGPVDSPNNYRRIPGPLASDGTGVLLGKTVVSCATSGAFAMVLCSDGTLASWGTNTYGQLGIGNTTTNSSPVAVNTSPGSALYGKRVVAVAAGNAHGLALCSDGTVASWGYNGKGQLGDGTTTDHWHPVAVNMGPGSALNGKRVTAIAAGQDFSLALCADGSLTAWGENAHGQLGDNTTAPKSLPVTVGAGSPASALNGRTISAIAAGGVHGIVLCDDGTVVTFGFNDSGQLGDNSTTDRKIPVTVTTQAGSALYGKTVTGIAAGYRFSLALCEDGTVTAWGTNADGQLGDNTTNSRVLPVAVNTTEGVSALSGKSVLAVSTGYYHSLAVCSDGSLAAWGNNRWYQLGDNTNTTRLVPVRVNSTQLTDQERFVRLAHGSSYYCETSLALVSSSVKPPTPSATADTPADLTLTGAVLRGRVNAQGFDTTVTFAYGTNGVDFPNQVVLPVPVNANGEVSVGTTISGLTKGTLYYYRLTAASKGGFSTSNTSSFITLTEPTAVVGSATAFSTTSALVTGTINAHGSDTQVFFDYGTNPVGLQFSVQASPATAFGYADTAVAATLPNLLQATTYYFRIRGTSVAGVGTSFNGSFQLDTISGVNRVIPGSPPDFQGYVFVTLAPSSIPTGWRFVGEQQWRASGVPAGGLTTGDRQIEFRPVPGYLQPPRQVVSVVSGAQATVVNATYYEAAIGSPTGALSVVILPESIADPGLSETERAQWRLLGEGDSTWRDSESALTSLPPGDYLVECKQVGGRATPPPVAVTVVANETALATVTYLLEMPASGTQPSVLPFDTVSGSPTLPYGYVGQIRSDVGLSTGFVVKQRVVATAAHVVFDDGTLSYVTGLQWLFQRDRGTYEPVPQVPRGFYLFDGYATQRAADNSPGVSTPAAQNLDTAALYFLEDAGRGGYGGYLASDLDDNEFLISPRMKMLVGYPVDGITVLRQGRMHATPASNVSFVKAFGHTYATSDIRASGGASGGPLCVQNDNGTWYPAAIYLGGNGQTVVRSIDSQVIELFNRAEVSGNGGDNNTGGGITHTSVSGTFSSSSPGAIKVLVEPEGARAGALWRLVSDTTWRTSGTQKSGLNAGFYTLELTTPDGYQAVAPQVVNVTGGQLLAVTFTYAPLLTALESWRLANFGTAENTGNAADNADPDGDGSVNRSEYAAGTNPNSAMDVLKLLSMEKTSGGFTVTVEGKAGRSYILQRSSSLTVGYWSNVVSIGPLSTGQSSVPLTDPNPLPSFGFYRIEVTAP